MDGQRPDGAPVPANGGRAFGLRAIAAVEATKGVLVLAAGMGLLGLVHRDVQAAAETLVRHLHLSPSARYPRVFLALTAKLDDAWLWALAGGSLLYAGLRFTEAFGLWHGKRWAKWLGAASGGIYVPLEIAGLVERVDALRVVSLVVNLVVVWYLLASLRRELRGRASAAQASGQVDASP
jgi:uncharacterized membrane protein (DUF2068 family)